MTVFLHRFFSLPSPVPFITDYHVPHLLRLAVFIVLNVIFGLDNNEYTTDYSVYGWLTIANGGLTLLMAARTNLFAIVLRIPSSIILQYHRWLGIATVANATTHFAYNIKHYLDTDQFEFGIMNQRIQVGLMAWLSLALIFVTALPIVRRRSFEVFYYTHSVFFAFMVGALIHTTNGPEFLLPGFFLWIADRAIRMIYNFRVVNTLSLTHYDGGVTKFRVKGKMLRPRSPGQIVWVQIPDISFFNWHPFTVASVPCEADGSITIAVRGLGGYTRKLQNEAGNFKQNVASDDMTATVAMSPVKQLKVRIDGPYGVGRLQWGTQPVAVLVAGGVGITPGISIASHLIQKAVASASSSSPAPISHIHLLWAVKDACHIQWFEAELQELANAAAREEVPITFDITVHVTIGGCSPIETVTREESGFSARCEPKTIDRRWIAHSGRPDIMAWFYQIKVARAGMDAAVNACGPRSLINEARKASIAASWEKGLFHIEEEVFEL